MAIDLDQTPREQGRTTEEVCQNLLVRISLHH